MSKNVLIVDDSLYMRSIIKATLESGGYRVIGMASKGADALDLAYDLQPDIITLDQVLPDMMGTDILKVYYDGGLRSKVIMISAAAQQSIIRTSMQFGARAYLLKPFTSEQLLNELKKL